MPEVLARYGMNMKPQEVPNRLKCSNFKLRRKGALKGHGQKQLGNSMIANGAGLKVHKASTPGRPNVSGLGRNDSICSPST